MGNNFSEKRKILKTTKKKFRFCPFCFRKLKEGESYYFFFLYTTKLRREFKNFLVTGSSGIACERCYFSKLPESLRKILEGRDFIWELDLENGFWLNKETQEREYFDE
jgi:hypothetical protein